MRTKSFFFSVVVMLLAYTSLVAQTADSKFAIGLNAISSEYNGDYGSGIWNFDRFYPGGGLSLGMYLNPSFDLGLQGNFGNYGYIKDAANRFFGNKFDMSLLGRYKFNNGYILKETAKFYPFLTAGIGFATYSRASNDVGASPTIITPGADFIIPVGAGLKYQITDRFALQYQYLYNFTNHDNRDENRGASQPIYATKAGNDAFGEHMFSLIFSLGKAKDTDKDGVADKYDLCANTPANMKVDEYGCPVDGDKDGIADYLDKCSDTPANVKVDAYGCPVDSDKDGVPDYLDKSPGTPAGVKVDAEGRPLDGDKDGVADYLDKCANTPAGIKVDASGCPVDTDKDGIADHLDKCNDTPANVKVDANGCPIDTDKDGVADYMDKCPTVPGIFANKGCPEVKEEVKKIFTKALQGIQFETGKEIIKKISFPILNQVADVMKNNPSYLLEINGHSDSQGDDDKNLLLSQKRADAVKQYIVAKGISADRMTSKGYGETMPVADNATAEGRAKNRRVEFKVIF
ncbi:MAG: OmpA family protein [Paludibacter sp.]|nr:OmpA family protein [Paludibacter sp.]